MLGEVGRQRSSWVEGNKGTLSPSSPQLHLGGEDYEKLGHWFADLLSADVSEQYCMPVDENLTTALFLHRSQRTAIKPCTCTRPRPRQCPTYLVPALQPLGVHSVHRQGILQLEGAFPQLVWLLWVQASHHLRAGTQRLWLALSSESQQLSTACESTASPDHCHVLTYYICSFAHVLILPGVVLLKHCQI